MITVIEGFEKYIEPQSKTNRVWDDQRLYRFDNNFGASIIFHKGSYGFEEDMVELAVIRWYEDGKNWSLTYDTEITDDIIGYLTQEQAKDILEKIKKLEDNHEITKKY